MILKYSADFGLEETTFLSCRRCGINMQIHVDSARRMCDDCVEYEVFEFGKYDWLFGKEKENG